MIEFAVMLVLSLDSLRRKMKFFTMMFLSFLYCTILVLVLDKPYLAWSLFCIIFVRINKSGKKCKA